MGLQIRQKRHVASWGAPVALHTFCSLARLLRHRSGLPEGAVAFFVATDSPDEVRQECLPETLHRAFGNGTVGRSSIFLALCMNLNMHCQELSWVIRLGCKCIFCRVLYIRDLGCRIGVLSLGVWAFRAGLLLLNCALAGSKSSSCCCSYQLHARCGPRFLGHARLLGSWNVISL